MKASLHFSILILVVCLTACIPVTSIPSVPPTLAFTRTETVHVPAMLSPLERTDIASTLAVEMIYSPYQDVRLRDLSGLSQSLGEQLIKTLWFDETTRWSQQDKLLAEKLLQAGKNPGLGIRALQAQGLSGNGVTVAVIDQPTSLDHPEFQGKVVQYFDTGSGTGAGEGSMHGPAVLSLLAGENIGTAPDVTIYYVAIPSWKGDAQYYADALDWLIAENKKLSENDKIRVVSVSSIPSGIWSSYTHQTAYDAAFLRATKAGILVLDCTFEHGITAVGSCDLSDPDDVTKCKPSPNMLVDRLHASIYIPADGRTTATGGSRAGSSLYQYTGPGGLSWTTPYLTGVLALGWQINPGLSGDRLIEMIFDTAYVQADDTLIIDPAAFIQEVQATTP